jgi:predicted nucleic acid-binding protein
MSVGPVIDETSLVLDTDILTAWRYGRAYIQRAISEYIGRLKRPPALASINVFEALSGFEAKLLKPDVNIERTRIDLVRTDELIHACTVLPFDDEAARIAAYIFARLSRSDQNKHWCDAFIAATALSHGHGVATGNQRDFALIASDLPSSHHLLRLAIWKP